MSTVGLALLVALAGALGSAARHLAGRRLDRDRPVGTLLVNLVGSAVLGGLVGAGVPPTVLAVLGVGLCGGLTTYSAFAVQAAGLRWPRAAAYVLVTVGGCLVTGALGWWLGWGLGSALGGIS